ncbi:isochorismatase [Microtetraspora sp. NBRC 13810]|uniref:cysteine hydrolase family protein n=1 Tax=Microtetraspora sp. NBRC 13810 TaxID=3030990 RepID=UPI0024A3767C|nr:isochorismatase family cysteine hydrolase [Microtetraspora sp. NBRC 13810]GLW11545.1 isochorismatase [Microtetraspora sp. NBRC 13810]
MTRPRAEALLVVDVQHYFARPEFLRSHGVSMEAVARVQAAVGQIAGLVDDARSMDVPIYWIQNTTRPDSPWEANRKLRGSPAAFGFDACVEGTELAEFYGVQPFGEETVVRKEKYSAFIDTPLESMLRQAGADRVTVTGLTTECCVASTANDAFQRGWDVQVPADCCASYQEDMHHAALATIALNIGDVTVREQVAAGWCRAGGA